MSMHSRPVKGHISLILAGLIIGTFMISPASADFRKSISHIVNHAKGTFYTKGQTNDRYVNSCDIQLGDLGQLYAGGMVEESLVTTSFQETALQYWFSCWGTATVRQVLEGHYQLDLAGMSDPEHPSALPVVQVTGIGQGVNASYQWTNVADHGVVIDVWLKDLAGTPSSSDFTFSLMAVLEPNSAVTPTRVPSSAQLWPPVGGPVSG